MCQTNKFYLWLLQIVVLLGLLILCLWLSLRPKNPTFTIVDLSIPISSSNITSSPAEYKESFLYNLEIKNRNKYASITYGDTALIFYYGNDTAGKSNITKFQQGKDKTTQRVDHVYGGANPRVWNSLLNATANGKAELKVCLSTKVQFKTLGIKSKHHGLELEGTVKIGSDGRKLDKKGIKLHKASKK